MDCLNWDLFDDEIDNNLCDFIDEEQSANGYHLRITGEREKLKLLAEEYIKHYKPHIYIFAYEEVDSNHHIHAHLEYKQLPKSFKQSLSQWMKSKGYAGKYYHKKVTTTDYKNKLYIIKDLDVLMTNISASELEQLKETTEEINEEKEMDQRHKLLKHFNDHLTDNNVKNYTQLSDIAKWIMYHYLNVYDKEPPLSHIKGYSIYIASKCSISAKFNHQLNHLFDNMFN